MGINRRLANTRLLQAALLAVLAAAGCSVTNAEETSSSLGEVPRPTNIASSTIQTATSTTRLETTTTSSPEPQSSADIASCQAEPVGISSWITSPGPVAVCLNAYHLVSGGAFSGVLETGVILERSGVVDAESAFAAYAEGLTEDEIAAGYGLVGGDGELDGLYVTRPKPDEIVVHLPSTIADIGNLSTSFTAGLFYELIFATAFSDPTVELVSVIVDGEPSDLCGYLQFEPCVPVTRAEFIERSP